MTTAAGRQRKYGFLLEVIFRSVRLPTLYHGKARLAKENGKVREGNRYILLHTY